VVFHFVDIGRIVDHHSLNFLFRIINEPTNKKQKLKIFSLMIIKRSKKNGFQNMNLEIFWTRLY
jgi:hypothetical protein